MNNKSHGEVILIGFVSVLFFVGFLINFGQVENRDLKNISVECKKAGGILQELSNLDKSVINTSWSRTLVCN